MAIMGAVSSIDERGVISASVTVDIRRGPCIAIMGAVLLIGMLGVTFATVLVVALAWCLDPVCMYTFKRSGSVSMLRVVVTVTMTSFTGSLR